MSQKIGDFILVVEVVVPPLSLGSFSLFQEPSACFCQGSRLALRVGSLYSIRKYTMSSVWTERMLTSVDPFCRFFPPVALKVSGAASFQALPMTASSGGGAATFLESKTFFGCAPASPTNRPRVLPATSNSAASVDRQDALMRLSSSCAQPC